MSSQPTDKSRANSPPRETTPKNEPKPTGTKGEKLSSQGQLDEGSRKREKRRDPPPVIGEP